MQNTCATCLSQDRRLTPLKSIQLEDISMGSLNMDFVSPESWLCWECRAALARCCRFRRRAVAAHSVMLARYLAQGDSTLQTTPSEPLQCLSTLSVHFSTLSVLGPDTPDHTPDNPERPLHSIKVEPPDRITDEQLDVDEPLISNDCDDVDYDKVFVEVPIVNLDHKTKKKSETKVLFQTDNIPSKSNLRSTRKGQKYAEKRKEDIKDDSSSSSDDTPLAKIDLKNKERDKSKKGVRFDIPTVEIKVDPKGSDTESAYTDSDIGLDPEEMEAGANYSSGDKYTRDKFETRIISKERLLRNRELDKRSKEYQKAYRCTLCIKGFDEKIEYETHLDRFHSKLSGAFKCPVCGVRFARESRMRQHRARHYQSYSCRRCHYYNHSVRFMLRHQRNRHSAGAQQSYVCRHCAMEFPTPATLSYHVKTTHSGQRWNVVEELRPKRSYTHLRKHQRDPAQLPRCRVCQRTFVCKSYLIKHERSHAEPSQRQERECPHCGCKFRFLNAHIKKVHERNENAYCAECDIQFSSVFSYRHGHLKFSRRHNPVPDLSKRTVPCPYCDKKWPHQRDLDRHVILIHTKEYPLICDLCGKGFYYERTLRAHVAEKHEGVTKPKDKICKYCGKAFVQLQVLKQHLRVHTGEKPYECAHCPWKFSQRTSLVTHIKGKHPEHVGKTEIRKKRKVYHSSVGQRT